MFLWVFFSRFIWFLLNPERTIVLTAHEYKRRKVEAGSDPWGQKLMEFYRPIANGTVFHIQINVSSASIFCAPLQGTLKAQPCSGVWELKGGNPRKKGWQMWGEIHQAQQDCRRACLILKTDSWRAESPAAAAAPFSNFRGNRRNKENLQCRRSTAHALYALCRSWRRLVFVQLTFRDQGHQQQPDENHLVGGRVHWSRLLHEHDKDDVSVSCLLCSDVWT